MTVVLAPPRCAVVIAARDMEQFIGATIASVLSQTLAEIEVILVDDGSRDATVAIATAGGDPRLRVITMPGTGVSRARNAGLGACTASTVLFLDGDDLLTPGALAAMLEALEQSPHAVACVARHAKVAEDGRRTGGAGPDGSPPPDGEALAALLAKNLIVNGGACLIRTHAARAVGGFDPALRLGEDWDFWCRLAALGRFVALPGFVSVLYRQRPGSANARLRGSPRSPNFEAIEAIYSRPEISSRFDPPELARLRRLAETDAFWSAARGDLLRGNLARFLGWLAVGAARYPDSILRPRLVLRFVTGSLRMARG